MRICEWPGPLPPFTLASLPEKNKDEILFGVVMSSETWKSENCIVTSSQCDLNPKYSFTPEGTLW